MAGNSLQHSLLKIENKEFPLKIYFEHRRNSRVSIGSKSIIIRVPNYLPSSEKAKQIEDFKAWARQKILKNPALLQDNNGRCYKSGDILTLNSEEWALQISTHKGSSWRAKIIDGNLYLLVPEAVDEKERPKRISELISKLVAKYYLPSISRRLHELNERHIQRKISRIRLSQSKSRWGSCSSKGNINIATRLLLAPDPVIEYVLIHELAHLIEHNHSHRFWEIVERAMPDYKVHDNWLKKNGNECSF